MTQEIQKVNTPESFPHHEYKAFEQSITERFAEVIAAGHKLFRVDVDGLNDIYLENLPEEQQHYVCNACRTFIDRYGKLVFINAQGVIESAIWNLDATPKFFKGSVEKILKKVLKARISAPFISEELKLGIPKTGEWTHLHVILPKNMKHTDRVKTAHQLTQEYKQAFASLNIALKTFSYETVVKTIDLIPTLYRGDQVMASATFFLSVYDAVKDLGNAELKRNVLWNIVMGGPVSRCKIKNGMIGTLLEDIEEELPTMLVKSRFEQKMDPEKFGHAETLPSAAQVKADERLITSLEMEDSLKRQFATFDDIPEEHVIWKASDKKVAKTLDNASKSGGLFGNLTTKDAKPKASVEQELPKVTMTWAKFQRTVLPTAKSLKVQPIAAKVMALTTEAVKGSKPMFKWQDNPLSWSYAGGLVDNSKFRQRVEKHGGTYDNIDIRATLIWSNYTDLDIHAFTPQNREIYYGNKNVGGGSLDIDMNAGHGTTMEPVENIRWRQGTAPTGRYKFMVHNYADRDRSNNPFEVEIEVAGQVLHFSGTALFTNWSTSIIFDYDGSSIKNLQYDKSVLTLSGTSTNLDKYLEVKAIVPSPNTWSGSNKGVSAGRHTFFLTESEDIKLEEMGARSLFTEHLIPELHPARKTLEAFAAQTPLEIPEDTTNIAKGIGFIEDKEWNLNILVTTASGSKQLVTIDRWD